MDITADIKRTFKEGSVLTRLIYINLGVFVIVKLVDVIFYLAGQHISLIEWLAIPSGINDFLIFLAFIGLVNYFFIILKEKNY